MISSDSASNKITHVFLKICISIYDPDITVVGDLPPYFFMFREA